MNGNIQRSLVLLTLSLHYSYAELSVHVNVGLSDTSHSTQAYILRDYNDVELFEVWQDYSSQNPYNHVVISSESTDQRQTNYPRGSEKTLDNFFFDDSVEGDWGSSVTEVHLLNYTRITDYTDTLSGTEYTGRYKLQIEDAILTGTDSNGAATNFKTLLRKNAIAEYKPAEFTFAEIIAEGGLSFTAGELPVYITHTDIMPAEEGDRTTSYDPVYTNAIFAKYAGVALISVEDYDNMVVYKDDLFNALSRSSYALDGQYHYNSADAGVSVGYDFGIININVDVMAHYPFEVGTRESIDLIQYSPSAQFDGTFGVSVSFDKGSVGAAIGVSQLNGDIILTQLTRTLADGTIDQLDEVNYARSYTLDNNIRTISNLNEVFYFGELVAKGKPMTQNGVSIYAKYRLGFNTDDSTVLQQINLEQDSISVGALFQVF